VNEQVVVIGAGMMGPGIAAVSALAGNRTTIVHRERERAAEAVERAKQHIAQLAEGQLAAAEDATVAGTLLAAGTDLASVVPSANLIIEAISERLDEKQKLFAQLDEIADPGAIITSNTSGLRITDITRFMKLPGRTVTTHFWFPAHLVPLVEVVKGEATDGETAEKVRRILLGWGKSPVVVNKDLPGQLANRILQAIIREAVNIVESGLATAGDVDTAIKAGMAMRFPVWGPLEHIDAVGLDLALSVQRDVLPGLARNEEPAAYLEALCQNGSLGHKSGEGFYNWSVKSMPHLAACRDRFIMETVRLMKKLQDNGECL